MTVNDAYQILGLPRDATAAQVKAAYRRRAVETHPDRGGQAAEFIRIRAAYEILSTFLQQPLDDDIPVPDDLREIIGNIVRDFREQQRWAEAETVACLARFETHMSNHIQNASRGELRRFTATFANSWDAVIEALFKECNSRCDTVMQRYENWYTENTQAVFDQIYRRELLAFPWRRRFWEAFLLLGAISGALTAVVGWEGPWRRWLSIGMIIVAAGLSFLVYWWQARQQREVREKAEPLSVVVFELHKNAVFPTEATLRRGRRTTAALGMAGLFLGNAATGGIAVPLVGAVAGTALGGAFDRLLNPTARMSGKMQDDLRRFMAFAGPQVTGYVLKAHDRLLGEVSGQVVGNYQERVRSTVRLLTAGDADRQRSRQDQRFRWRRRPSGRSARSGQFPRKPGNNLPGMSESQVKENG